MVLNTGSSGKKKSERSPQKPFRISLIFDSFYAKSREKYMDFEETNEEFEGKITRNLKEKHMEFFTRENFKINT
jgi:hypothetical protein